MKRYSTISFILFCLTTIASAQWVQQNSGVGVNLNGVHFVSPTKGWVVGASGTILSTTDGGSTWTKVTSPTSNNLNKIWFADSLDGWITGDNGTILSTTDGGSQWVSDYVNQPYVSSYYSVFAAEFGGKNEAWAGGGQSANGLTQIEKFTNGQWAPQIAGFAGRVTGIYFVNDSLGWAVGDSSLVLSTTNGGRWWNQESVPALPPMPYFQGFVDVKFFNPKVGLVVGNAGVIMRSTDGGASWNVVRSTPKTFSILFRIYCVNDSVAYVAGDSASTSSPTIMLTTDQGKTWKTQDAPTLTGGGAHYEDVYFYNDSLGWAVGNWGAIIHTTDGGGGSLLPTPALLLPTTTDTLAVSDTLLSWNGVPTATHYEVQIALDSAFSSIVVDSKSVKDTSLALSGLFNTILNPDTKYFWRVKALSGNGFSQFSEIWSFIVGTLTSVNKATIPHTFSLSQNYPNPFNPTTVINYALPKRSHVTLIIYDDLGRKVETLVDHEQNAGNYSVDFNASRLPSGAYFYRIQAGNFNLTKKLLLLK